MLTVTIDQLHKTITDGDFKRITFYEGYVRDPKENRYMFHRFQSENPQEVADHAREFLGEYPALFTVLMERKLTGTAEPKTMLGVDARQGSIFKPLNGGVQGTQFGTTGFVDEKRKEEEIYNRVLDRVKREMEINHLKMQLDHANMKLNGLQSHGDKLAYVGTKIVENIMDKKILNGKQEERVAIQGFNQHRVEKPGDNNKPTAEELKEAFLSITEDLGDENIIIIAKKLKEDPSKIQMIKTFLT